MGLMMKKKRTRKENEELLFTLCVTVNTLGQYWPKLQTVVTAKLLFLGSRQTWRQLFLCKYEKQVGVFY